MGTDASHNYTPTTRGPGGGRCQPVVAGRSGTWPVAASRSGSMFGRRGSRQSRYDQGIIGLYYEPEDPVTADDAEEC
jgi:hypothetical protein